MLSGNNEMNEEKIKIAIIDSGFDENFYKTQNPIIKKCGIKEKSNIIDDNIQDDHGHGTGITKILDDICENIEFMIFKILNKHCQATDEQLITALDLAICENADIINISLGTTNKDIAPHMNKLCRIAQQKNIIIVTTCPNDTNKISWPYKSDSVIKVKANSKISDNNIYYDENEIFSGRGIHHLIPWIGGDYTYSASNSFSTPYVIAKIVNIMKIHKKIGRKDLLEKLKSESRPIDELSDLIIIREKCNSFKLLKITQEILMKLLNKRIEFTRLTLQGMTPELTVDVLKEIENNLGVQIKYSVYNFIDFEYIENIVNRIEFVKDEVSGG